MVPGATGLLVLGSHCGDPPHARVVLSLFSEAHVRPAGPSVSIHTNFVTVTSECSHPLSISERTSKSGCLDILSSDRHAHSFRLLLHLSAALEIILRPTCWLGHACACAHSCPTLCGPTDGSPTDRLCPRDFPDKNTGMGYHFLLGIFPTLIKPASPTLAGGFFTTELHGKLRFHKWPL